MSQQNMKHHKYNAKGAGWYTVPDLMGPFKKDEYLNLEYYASGLEVVCFKRLRDIWKSATIVHQPPVWDFNERSEKPFRAHSQYRPDFYIKNLKVTGDREKIWVEAKGVCDQRSLVLIGRAIKLYPERRLLIFTGERGGRLWDAKDFLEHHKQLKKSRREKKIRLNKMIAERYG